jgi:gliding motility-associated-like protein
LFSFSSDLTERSLNLIRSTAFNYIRRGTVDTANNQFLIEYYIDTSANINNLNLLGGLSALPADTLLSKPVPNPFPFPDVFNYAGDVSTGPQNFQIESIDDCNLSLASNPVSPIFLSGNTDQTAVNTLNWTSYQMSNATLLNYRVFRIVNGNAVNLTTLLPGDLTYDHNILNEPSDDGNFCYVVEGNYRLDIPGIGVTEDLVTSSNILCLQQCPVVYIPNAFVPQGQNTIFRPVFLYENLSNYQMQIFDRWGNLIFRTQDPQFTWDGTCNGQPVPEGVYIYLLKGMSIFDTEINNTGDISVIR